MHDCSQRSEPVGPCEPKNRGAPSQGLKIRGAPAKSNHLQSPAPPPPVKLTSTTTTIATPPPTPTTNMPELRQRKNKAASGADAAAGPDTASSSSAFSQQQQNDRNRRNLDAATEQVMRKKRPSFIGRFLLFIGLPTVMGFCGMFISYLSNVAEGKSDASLIDFDKDFVFPFMLTLVLICVVGFQTGGFTRDEPKPFIAWPKVRRKKKVVHRRIIVDADGNETVEEVPAEQAAAAAAPRRSRRTRKED